MQFLQMRLSHRGSILLWQLKIITHVPLFPKMILGNILFPVPWNRNFSLVLWKYSPPVPMFPKMKRYFPHNPWKGLANGNRQNAVGNFIPHSPCIAPYSWCPASSDFPKIIISQIDAVIKHTTVRRMKTSIRCFSPKAFHTRCQEQ